MPNDASPLLSTVDTDNSIDTLEKKVSNDLQLTWWQQYKRDYYNSPALLKITQIASIAIPAICSGAAVLYLALSAQDGTAFGIVEGIFAFAYNYPQFFIPLAKAIAAPLTDYIAYAYRCYNDQAFRRSQPDHRIMFNLVRDFFAYTFGYYACGLLPSVANQVSWLNNPFFIFGLLYEASLSLQAVGLRSLIDNIFMYLPAVTDKMVIDQKQQRVIAAFEQYLDDMNLYQLSFAKADRKSELREILQQKNFLSEHKKKRLVLSWLFFTPIVFALFIASNTGNYKDTALSTLITPFEKTSALMTSVVFGLFGASIFGSLASAITMLLPSIIKNNRWESLIAVAIAGLSYLTAKPSVVTLNNVFSPGGEVAHDVNFDATVLAVFQGLTYAGSTYANALWAELFAFNLIKRSKSFYNKSACAHEVREAELAKKDPHEKIQIIAQAYDASAEGKGSLQSVLNTALHKMAPDLTAKDALQQLQRPLDQASNVKVALDDQAKSRDVWVCCNNLLATGLNLMLLSAGLPWYTAMVGMAVVNILNPLTHYHLDKINHRKTPVYINASDSVVEDGLQVSDEVETSASFFKPSACERALNYATKVLISALPVAVAAGSAEMIKLACQYLFEMDHIAAENTAQSWQLGLTAASTWLTGQVAFKR